MTRSRESEAFLEVSLFALLVRLNRPVPFFRRVGEELVDDKPPQRHQTDKSERSPCKGCRIDSMRCLLD